MLMVHASRCFESTRLGPSNRDTLTFEDLGEDYFERPDRERLIKRLVKTPGVGAERRPALARGIHRVRIFRGAGEQEDFRRFFALRLAAPLGPLAATDPAAESRKQEMIKAMALRLAI